MTQQITNKDIIDIVQEMVSQKDIVQTLHLKIMQAEARYDELYNKLVDAVLAEEATTFSNVEKFGVLITSRVAILDISELNSDNRSIDIETVPLVHYST